MSWVNSEVRLPDARYGEDGEPPVISDDVLICFGGFDGMGSEMHVGNYDHEKRGWYIEGLSNKHRNELADHENTHWMPLPNPPFAASRSTSENT